MRKQKGFSLIELLIVIAIILIIAAIAIPSLLRSRMLASQSAAAHNIRTLVTAQSTYLGTYGLQVGYAQNMLSLGSAAPCNPLTPATAAAACLVDPVLAAGNKGGYNYNTQAGNTVAPNGPTNFIVSAWPQAVTTGNVSYCATDEGVVWFLTPPGNAFVPFPGPCPGLVLQN